MIENKKNKIKVYADEITKKELKTMGFIDVRWSDKVNNYVMCRYWYKTNSKVKMEYREIPPKKQRNTNQNGNYKDYWKFSWSYGNATYCTTLSRILIAWYRKKIKARKVADHKNNNSTDNRLENLRALTIPGNNRKRFTDHPDCKCFNQYQNTKTGDSNE